VGVRVAWQTFFWINYSSIKTVGATVLGGLWALEWAWHPAETNWKPNHNSSYSFRRDLRSSGRTDRRTDWQTDMARSTRLVILKNMYTLRGRKCFLLPLTYFLTNLVYPLTLRVTGTTNYLPQICQRATSIVSYPKTIRKRITDRSVSASKNFTFYGSNTDRFRAFRNISCRQTILRWLK